jgi:hypothetical protein
LTLKEVPEGYVRTSEIVGGTIDGPGDITLVKATTSKDPVNHPPKGYNLIWRGGTLAGSGKLNVQPGATLEIAPSSRLPTLQDRTLVNQFGGTVAWETGDILLKGAATIQNSGRFSAYLGAFKDPTGVPHTYTAGTLYHDAGNATARFDNLATGTVWLNVRADKAANKMINVNVPVNNQKDIVVAGGGTVSFNDGGQNAGTIYWGASTDDKAPYPTSTIRFGVATFDGGKTYNTPTFKWLPRARLAYVAAPVVFGNLRLEGNPSASTSAYPTIALSPAAGKGPASKFSLPNNVSLTATYAAFRGAGTVELTDNPLSSFNAIGFYDGATVNVGNKATVDFIRQPLGGKLYPNDLDTGVSVNNLGLINVKDNTIIRFASTAKLNNGSNAARGAISLGNNTYLQPSTNGQAGSQFVNWGDLSVLPGAKAYIDIPDVTVNPGSTEKANQNAVLTYRTLDKAGNVLSSRTVNGPVVPTPPALKMSGAFDLTGPTLTVFAGSTITGAGTVGWGATENDGLVAPGDGGATGVISFAGNFTQGPGGALALALAPPGPTRSPSPATSRWPAPSSCPCCPASAPRPAAPSPCSPTRAATPPPAPSPAWPKGQPSASTAGPSGPPTSAAPATTWP